jgi:hypothetical protein
MLKDADARLTQRPDVLLSLLEDLFGTDSRAGGKIENAIRHGRVVRKEEPRIARIKRIKE